MDIQPLVLQAHEFASFNPLQQSVLGMNPFGKSIVVSAPTAAGKTVVAELLALHAVLNEGHKVVYTCPLRALAAEHYHEFKKKYAKEHGIRVTIATGDFDSASQHLQNYDVIFTTFEKLNSLIRHRAEWLPAIGFLVVDELHELDSDRGATLEITVTQLRSMCSRIKILGLSATIPNARELASWLSAELVESDFRPIPLKEGVHFSETLHFSDGEEKVSGKNALPALVQDTIHVKQKQVLVFANTRKNAENHAKSSANTVSSLLTFQEKEKLEKDAQAVLAALESPTEQCRSLAALLRQGVCFHHAGLMEQQRSVIERAFRENRLKLIAATPTLAAGVNLPAHTVIIPSVYRYGSNGMERIPVREYKQMCGRAGRPRYDTEGRALLIARSEDDARDLLQEYVQGDLEDVSSHLSSDALLRMHVLGLIAVHQVFDVSSLESFFSKTFFARQAGDMLALLQKLQRIIRELGEMGFVEGDAYGFSATRIGKRVSELYLDPKSAFALVQALKKSSVYQEQGYLFLLANTGEFQPHFSVSKSREAQLWQDLLKASSLLPVSLEQELVYDPAALQKFNAACVLGAWIHEVSEQHLLKEFSLQPGVLFAKLRVCDWLVYAAGELARVLDADSHVVPLARLRKRLQHGVKEELVPLTEVKGIGRVRARRLFRANIRSIAGLKHTDIVDLKKILGEKTAVHVKQALGQMPGQII